MALLPILRVEPADLPPLAIVCGDPFRAEVIAGKLEEARELAFAREYRTFIGVYQGMKLAVVSHGVGCPGAAVCFEELIKAGVTTIIRVGTAGALSGGYRAGSLIVSTAAVREEGLTKQLVPSSFPAVADSEVTAALYKAALEAGAPSSVGKGITLTVDAFFSGVVELPHETYKRAGVIAVEMEIAALYVIASLRGIRAGAIVALDGDSTEVDEAYDPHNNIVAEAVEAEIRAALNAMVVLAGERG
ncbi:uridine phosphorylase [Paenibacillus phyllosphaerae]|uniref:Uridine phosphorylase n=1 Tax=Paenibacillus phyllosphaerae TaxID=274593 RepID=A0A7W5B3Z4_9BACL|nr:nucleoside phosphorylase [Paenibacillus phyllosphaerae]MBB3113521.1 uridine phosphorylase [Paenibacillus phyllosphaerae]